MMAFASYGRRFAAVALAASMLAGCYDLADIPKHLQPLPASVKKTIARKGMAETSPILVRIFKEESVLEVWKQDRTGRFALLTTYDICKWSGKLGPKHREGDRQAPEGFYTITPAQMNPNSSYHLSFNLGFPNAYDQAQGSTGTHLMVHGACSSAGCYSMGDEQIQEIYTLARLAFQGGQRSFQVQAFPFRMTPQNMAMRRGDPNYEFWRMLKEGYDHFEVTHLPPKVAVCSKRYVFNAEPVAGVAFNPTGECPEMSVPDPIRVAVAEKATKDAARETIIAQQLGTGGAGGDAAPATPSPEDYETMLAAGAGDRPVPAAAVAPAEAVPADGADGATLAAAPDEAPAADAVPGAAEATPDPAAVSTAVPTATAYAPREEEGGFFSRLVKKVW